MTSRAHRLQRSLKINRVGVSAPRLISRFQKLAGDGFAIASRSAASALIVICYVGRLSVLRVVNE